MLPNGSLFPRLSLANTTGDELLLPTAVQGSYAVVLAYRGSWCPFCVGQLRSFAARNDALLAENIATVALSADSCATARKTVEELRIPFPVACEADVPGVAKALECYTDPLMTFFQSTGFVLDPEGSILLAVYSSGPIGRLSPTDVMGFVNRRRNNSAPIAS
jgi:peroxiredoxin